MKFRVISYISVLLIASALIAFPGTSVQAVINQPAQWFTPLELNFGPVGVGSSAPQRVVTITNSGNVPLINWAGGAVGAPFNASQDCNIQGGVLPGHSCHYYFNFSPTTVGTFSATSYSSTNAGPINIIVHGTGVGAQASYDATGLDFGDVYTSGTTPGSAPQQVVTIRNTGLAPLTGWAGGAVPAPFNASQDCNIQGGVLPGHSCHYFFNFSTTTASTFTATSSSATNGGPITVNLRGKSHSSILAGGGQQISPYSLDFGPVGVGNTSQTLEATITNNGIYGNITNWAGGAVGVPFDASQDCNITGGLPLGSSCHYYFTFHPTSAGSFTATSNLSDSYGSFSVTLHGTGVAPSLTADSTWVDFGPAAPVGLGAQQVVTLTNTGLSNITGWAGGAVSAPFNGSQDCNIPGGLPPGASCHFYYTFRPNSTGSYSAVSTFSTNAGTMQIKMQGIYRSPNVLFLPLMSR